MRDPRAYLGAGVLGLLVVLLMGAVVPGLAVGPTYAVDIVVVVTLVAVVGLWLTCRTEARLSMAQRTFLVGGFIAWALCVIEALVAGFPTQPAFLLMGAMLGLSLLRPPDGRRAAWLLDLLAVGVVIVCLVVLVLEVTGVEGSWYDELQLGALIEDERSRYWIPLADVLGLDGRWAGPFDHPGRSGQVGALILIWGATRRGWLRVVLVVSGAFLVLLAGSNTAYLSVAVGVATVVVVAVLRMARRLPRWVKVLVSVGAAAAVILLVVVIVGPNTGLTGRTSIWPTYVDLWRSSPWTGIGDVGVATAQHDGLLPSWAYHAHNSWLDLLVRHGVVVLAASVIAIGGAVAATVAAARAGVLGPLGVLVVLMVASITQPMVLWLLPTVPMVMLVLAVLASATPGRDAPAAGRSRAPGPLSTGDRVSPAASSGAAGPS